MRPLKAVVGKIARGSKLVRAWELKGGISAEMTGLELEHPDGQAQKVIVRRPGAATLKNNPNAAQDEFRLLQVTRAAGLVTPKPILFDESGDAFATPYLVVEYMEGEPEFAPQDRESFVKQFAAELVNIHVVNGTNADLGFLAQHADPFGDELAKAQVQVSEWFAQAQIRRVLQAASPIVARNAPVLLHGDFWAGNLLWREGKPVAVIDWEDAQLGDPLRDFAIARLDMLWIFGQDALEAFTQHYRSATATDFTQLPYWDLYAALRLARLAGPDLADWVAFFPPFGRNDITERSFQEDYERFVSSAFAKVSWQASHVN